MKTFIIVLLLGFLLWMGYQYYGSTQPKNGLSNTTEANQMTKCITSSGEVIYGKVPDGIICKETQSVKGALTIIPSQRVTSQITPNQSTHTSSINPKNPIDTTSKCDGRTYCSQMSSCEEAKYFLSNCPGVKMDGNGDGIPCEKQWCN